MANRCSVKKVIRGRNAVDGAGVHLVRVFGHDETAEFDPFLMMDAFDSTKPEDYIKGFPWHPHRGIETVTYLIEGDIEHGDSLGNAGRILDGECQWMTAGSGIIHQEMPQPHARMQGVQLWLNLPKQDKMTAPQYNGIEASAVPSVQETSAQIRVIAGKYKETPGAFCGKFVDVLYLDVALDAGAKWQVELDGEATAFSYLFRGTGLFGAEETAVPERSAVLFSHGDVLSVTAGAEPLRFILLCGRPLGEPIAWGGPIVMNTEEELRAAFRELNEGTFIKK